MSFFLSPQPTKTSLIVFSLFALFHYFFVLLFIQDSNYIFAHLLYFVLQEFFFFLFSIKTQIINTKIASMKPYFMILLVHCNLFSPFLHQISTNTHPLLYSWFSIPLSLMVVLGLGGFVILQFKILEKRVWLGFL